MSTDPTTVSSAPRTGRTNSTHTTGTGRAVAHGRRIGARARRQRGAGVALALASVLVVTACSGDEEPEEPTVERAPGPVPAPVELAAASAVGSPLRLGLVVSASSAPGEGADLLGAAAGAQVAVERLRLGGVEVELDVVDDKGTRQGAEAAVAQLVGDGVAGIVAATAGDHLDPALDAASEAGVAVLAPYLRDAEGLPAGVWLTGAVATDVDAALRTALDELGASAPFVATGDGVDVGVMREASADLDETTTTDLVRRVRAATRGASGADAVVVGASTARQAEVVAALQGELPDLPLLLTPEALSPGFAQALSDAGGTPADELVSVGVDAGDTTTLGQGEAAEAVASYFSALRMLAGDPEARDLFDTAPFADVAGGADTSSHDAVVALAVAAGEAGSAEAGAVRTALEGLEVAPSDGLAGPALTFTTPTALPGAAVVPLHATTQDPGVRPASTSGTVALRWFAVPGAES